MNDTYDLVVIGAGSGGVRAARMAAGYGARVAIVEEYRVGGTCVIRGCVPKKLLVYASRFRDVFDIAESFGWQVDASFDWPTLIANKNREIDRLEGAYISTLGRAGVEIIRDRAVVTGPTSVQLQADGRTLAAGHILVATGARPFRPQIPGCDLAITSNEAFHLETLPHSILIEGAGYIAVEFATVFCGLGVETMLNYRGDRILRGFDDDMRLGLEEGLRWRGVDLQYNRSVTALERIEDGNIRASFSDGTTAEFGAVMFATGRLPNTEGLGLEEAGVSLGPNGAVRVDEFSRTDCPTISAVGDVTDRVALTPVAIREGAAFAETVFNDNPTSVDHQNIPSAVFAEPELAVVGLSEALAVSQHADIDVYVARFRPMMNTLGDRPERMILKLITAPDAGRVLGCHILGPGAAEMIQLVAIAVTMGATKGDLDRTMALHPSAAEELVTFKAPSYRYRDRVRSEP